MSSERRDKRKDDYDPRLEFISTHVSTTLRLKYEKWQKMITTEALKLIVLDWLNNAQRRILLLNVNPGGLLVPALSFPVSARGKSAYFVKKQSIAVTADNFRSEIILGDLPSHTVKSLAVLVDEVFFPLLNCPLNRKLWPEIVSRDVETQMKDIRNILAEVKGNISKKTVLSVTMETHIILEVADQIQKGDILQCEPTFINALEGMIINWTTQIYAVIKDSPQIDDISYLPSDEVAYWNSRFANLHNIYTQVRSPAIKAVLEILDATDSAYAKVFGTTLKNLILALHESQDISLWISPILKRTIAFSEVSFANSKGLVKPLIHVTYLIWTNSRYYCTKRRIVKLVKALSNLLILRASEDLDLALLFRGEADEGAMMISSSIEIIQSFKNQIKDYSTKIDTTAFNPEPWNFPSDDVFNNLDKFLGRLYDLQEIFDAATCFQNLERLEVGGSRGKYFTDQIERVNKEFKYIFQRWTTIKIDLINNAEKAKSFKTEKSKFFKNSEGIENKLGSVLVKAFESCSNIEQFMKLIQMTSTLLKRPSIERDVQSALPKIFNLCQEELEKTEHILNTVFDRYKKTGLEAIPNDNNFPLVAGAIMWIKEIQGRASNILKANSFVDYTYIDADRNLNLITRKNCILEKLNHFQGEIWNNWSKEIDEKIEIALNLLALKKESTTLKVNFSEDIRVALREAKCLVAMKVSEIPGNIMNLYEMSESFWKRKITLSRIEEWYNWIQEECSSCELVLVKKEMMGLDKLLMEASTKITWKIYDTVLIGKIFNTTKDIYDRIKESQNNVDLIIEKIRTWSREPLYKRSLIGKKLLSVDNKKRKYMNRVFQCLDTKRWISRLMAKNFRLFFTPKIHEEQRGVPFEEISEHKNSGEKDYLDGWPSEQVALFQEYREYVDDLIAKEIRKAVKIRFDIKAKKTH